MTKQIASLTRKASMEINPGQWETAEASFSIEDEVPEGTNRESHGAALRASVKAQVDEEMKRQKEELFSPGAPVGVKYEGTDFVPVHDVAAFDVQDAAGRPQTAITMTVEEKPPLPSDETLEAAAEALAPIYEAGEEVRTPIDEAGNELKAFVVQSFEVAETANGDKFLKVFGGPWKRPWVPAWRQAAELLFDDLASMDLGVVGPPYPLKALVKMGEYKNRPSPDSIDHWERIGG